MFIALFLNVKLLDQGSSPAPLYKTKALFSILAISFGVGSYSCGSTPKGRIFTIFTLLPAMCFVMSYKEKVVTATIGRVSFSLLVQAVVKSASIMKKIAVFTLRQQKVLYQVLDHPSDTGVAYFSDVNTYSHIGSKIIILLRITTQ